MLWYFGPLVYLFFVKKIFLPFSFTTLIFYFFGLTISALFFGRYKVESGCKRISFIWCKYLLCAVLLLQLFSVVKLGLGGNFNVFNHRQLVFDNPTYLFGSSYVFTLYCSFLLPFVVFISCFFIAFRVNKKLFDLTLVILFFDSIIMLGRFQLIYVIILFLMYLKFNPKINNNGNVKLALLIFIFVILSQAIIFFRQFFYDSSLENNFSFINL